MGPGEELGRGSHKQLGPYSFRLFRLTVKPRAPKPLPRIAPPCLERGKQSSALQSCLCESQKKTLIDLSFSGTGNIPLFSPKRSANALSPITPLVLNLF